MPDPVPFRASGPVYKKYGSGYVVELDSEGIRLRAEYIQARMGEYSAWLTAENSDGSGHLHRARVVLSSTTSKVGFARRASSVFEKHNSRRSVDWDDLVEAFCTWVEDRLREGGTVVNISEKVAVAMPPDQIAGFMPSKKLTWLYGPGSSSKGHIAVLAAVCITTGRPFLGKKVKQGNVMYCDWEDDEDVMWLRASGVARGMGIEVPPIQYVQMTGTLASHVNQLGRKIAEFDISTIVLDSARYAIGSTDDASSALDQFVDAAKLLNVTVLVIDHVSKEEIKNTKGPRMPIGFIQKYNAARWAWEVRKDQEEGDTVAHVGLYNTKTNYSTTPKPIGVRIEWSDLDDNGYAHSITFTGEDIRSSDELSQALKLPARLEFELKRGARSVNDVAESLGVDPVAVRVAFNRSKRFVKIPGSDLWGLADMSLANEAHRMLAIPRNYKDDVG